MMPRYIVHPGYIRSQKDNQLHYISAAMLLRLHNLPPYTPHIYHDPIFVRELEGDIHLYPDNRGEYPNYGNA